MILGYGPPVIVFDIYNNHGKLQTFKVILPLGSDKQLKKDHLGLVSCLEAKKLMRIKKYNSSRSSTMPRYLSALRITPEKSLLLPGISCAGGRWVRLLLFCCRLHERAGITYCHKV
ncbi:hypothetical protein A4U88_4815 [Serratia marcescens]|nr:hypothetical protein A4U88_4815 [Serratia marcescens]